MKKIAVAILTMSMTLSFSSCRPLVSETDESGKDVRSEMETDIDRESLDESVSETESGKTYTIHYDLRNKNATIESLEQTVVYGEEFHVLIPQVKNDEFTGWKVVGSDESFWNGVYFYKTDIQVYATWLSGSYSKIVR